MSLEGRPLRCPMCGGRTTWRENPHRPFCSARCRLADLDGWLGERYVVGGDAEAAEAPIMIAADPDDEPPAQQRREKT